MAKENEFLPSLNSWWLVFVLIAFGLYWANINAIQPKLKEMREHDSKKSEEAKSQ